MGTELFIAVGVFPVELLACQVSMICGQIGQDSSIYIVESSHLHNLHIFQT